MDGLKRESSTLERKFKPQCLNANASISMNGGTHKVAIEGTCNSFEPTFPFPYLMQPEFNMKEGDNVTGPFKCTCFGCLRLLSFTAIQMSLSSSMSKMYYVIYVYVPIPYSLH
eukprot:scaffold226806_cov15-Tisochrysis_lutea.AAC.1